MTLTMITKFSNKYSVLVSLVGTYIRTYIHTDKLCTHTYVIHMHSPDKHHISQCNHIRRYWSVYVTSTYVKYYLLIITKKLLLLTKNTMLLGQVFPVGAGTSCWEWVLPVGNEYFPLRQVLSIGRDNHSLE